MSAPVLRGGIVAACFLVLLSGCTIGRVYRGKPLAADPALLVEGQSTKADVLHLFGPPDQITHQTDGDAFVYRYVRQNFASLTLSDPVFTGLFLFNFRRQLEASERLVVLFDYRGVVRGVGYDRDTKRLPAL